MPQSLTKLYAHLIFSTKHRKPILDVGIRPQVHGCLAASMRNVGAPWAVVGVVTDHIHILFDMGKTLAPMAFVEHAKRESSRFIKTLGATYAKFQWQRGYGMFSVSPKDRDDVEAYVRNQVEHHRRQSFQDEFRSLLTMHGIEFDERYVWD